MFYLGRTSQKKKVMLIQIQSFLLSQRCSLGWRCNLGVHTIGLYSFSVGPSVRGVVPCYRGLLWWRGVCVCGGGGCYWYRWKESACKERLCMLKGTKPSFWLCSHGMGLWGKHVTVREARGSRFPTHSIIVPWLPMDYALSLWAGVP